MAPAPMIVNCTRPTIRLPDPGRSGRPPDGSCERERGWQELDAEVNRARQVAGRLRSGTVGHNAMRTDFGVSFGGYKQSGIGREGVHEGLTPFLEVKFMILEGHPEGYENTKL